MRLFSPNFPSTELVYTAFLFPLSVFSQSSSVATTPLPESPTDCEYKTINYITHTLPQQCLRTSWPGDKSTGNGTARLLGTLQGAQVSVKSVNNATPTTNATANGAGGSEPSDHPQIHEPNEMQPSPRPFMSFEDWKEMMLRKAGQDPPDLRIRGARDRDHMAGKSVGDSSFDSLGDDGEINLDFDVVSEKISNLASAPHAAPTDAPAADQNLEPVLYDDGRTQYYRSKDAGKTCKERFSYSSFDAGATVLKTNPGAKNAKAILVENKDSYMLLECSAKNKFVIVELSDDILVDTIVLANFEFFSSMIRQFRVSVSDRYPVKAEKWKDLGTFEARNSRDIQPFLVQNPLIWAKYVRVEFLSHYGNEYYCPVSLLRVHGTRMLESLKDTESPFDEDDVLNGSSDEHSASLGVGVHANASQEGAVEALPYPQGGNPRPDTHLACTLERHSLAFSTLQQIQTCAKPTASTPVLPSRPATALESRGVFDANEDHALEHSRQSDAIRGREVPRTQPTARFSSSQRLPASSAAASTASPTASTAPVIATVTVTATATAVAGNLSSLQQDFRPGFSEDVAASPPVKATLQPNSQTRHKGNSTLAPASPTVQESFFKAVTKRLQLLESNVTLSMKYMEDQSRSLQEIQYLAERRQLSRIDVFLDSLNETVLSELRNVRQQYDQVWQSTVIALESQREQSQRETVALSSRLSILAEEVVFQKRMAIVQAILLLSCLSLVIFSRAMTQPHLTTCCETSTTLDLNHPLASFPTYRDTPSYVTHGGKFADPESGNESGRDICPIPPSPSSRGHRLQIPYSGNPHHCVSTKELREGADMAPGGGHTLSEVLTGNGDYAGFHHAALTSTIISPDRCGAAAEGADLLQCEDGTGVPDRLVPVADTDLRKDRGGLRYVYQARSTVSSTARKPLPALPE